MGVRIGLQKFKTSNANPGLGRRDVDPPEGHFTSQRTPQKFSILPPPPPPLTTPKIFFCGTHHKLLKNMYHFTKILSILVKIPPSQER